MSEAVSSGAVAAPVQAQSVTATSESNTAVAPTSVTAGVAQTLTAPETTPKPAPSPSWIEAIQDPDTRGYVQNKGWKEPTDMLQSYRHMEKLNGLPQDRTLVLPKGDDAAEWSQVFEKLGKPLNADGYKLPMPEKGGDPEFMKWAQTAFHKAGLTQKQAAQVVEQWNGKAAEAVKAQAEAYQSKVAQEETSLKKEWGMAFEQNLNQARQAAMKLEMSPQELDGLERAIGYQKTMKMFQAIGAKTGEDSFVSGTRHAGNAMTPEAARNEFQARMSDREWVAKFASGDFAARQEKERLERFMYPELGS